MVAKNSGRISDYGLDAICEDIRDGLSQRQIATKLKVSSGALTEWMGRDPERFARAREARADTAQHWDEEAERVLKAASDQLEAMKARELAHHYRWRAKVIAPKIYGDKVSVDANLTLEGLVNQSLQISRDTLSPPVIEGQAEPEE